MNWREVRDATNVRYLLSTARTLGCSVQACLQGSGLDEAMLGAGGRVELVGMDEYVVRVPFKPVVSRNGDVEVTAPEED